jgi:transcription elongation factor GreA
MFCAKADAPGFVFFYHKGVIDMSDKKTVLTYEGLKRLEEELQELKVVRRKDIAAKIKEARGQGDLSENAEYDAAKEEQAEIEARIIQLEKMLRNAEVIDEEDLDQDSISVGSKVTVLDIEYNEEIEYSIVGSTEADPVNGRISNESPLGLALLSRKQGETIQVEAPDGVIEYRILKIA